MNTKFWMPTLTAIALSIGTVQAVADSGWRYDEDSDTIIYSYGGSPVTHSTSLSYDGAVQQSGTWYYSESIDNIVYHVEGNRSHHVRSDSSTDTIGFDSNLTFLDK
ncbi:MAG TPA: hypothetical protein VET88_04370 [Gammaproteobacteria bacterium]|nr:hypothetical protein [Gammaproteobacteria bacterium]